MISIVAALLVVVNSVIVETSIELVPLPQPHVAVVDRPETLTLEQSVFVHEVLKLSSTFPPVGIPWSE